jgi:hypothetical protein
VLDFDRDKMGGHSPLSLSTPHQARGGREDEELRRRVPVPAILPNQYNIFLKIKNFVSYIGLLDLDSLLPSLLAFG